MSAPPTDASSPPFDLVVAGGGAAGFFGAITFAEARPGSRVLILEKTSQVLGKVKISGGGRCNVTHACFDPRSLTQFYPRGSKQLIGPFNHWSPADTMSWFENRGVPLKIEPDGRVFPQSDSSQSIIDCLLSAAKNAGVDVPKDAIDKGIAYIKRSYQAERDDQGRPKGDAPFSYEPYGGRKTFSTTAAGLLSLQVAGQYEAPEVIGSANWLLTSPPEISEPWFFYGTYYYAQGMYQRGGEHAAIARQKTEQMLTDTQNPDGSWFPRNGNEKSAGAVYATSLALLSLSVYHHFLPIYQK
jgi:hypothetical protein